MSAARSMSRNSCARRLIGTPFAQMAAQTAQLVVSHRHVRRAFFPAAVGAGGAGGGGVAAAVVVWWWRWWWWWRREQAGRQVVPVQQALCSVRLIASAALTCSPPWSEQAVAAACSTAGAARVQRASAHGAAVPRRADRNRTACGLRDGGRPCGRNSSRLEQTGVYFPNDLSPAFVQSGRRRPFYADCRGSAPPPCAAGHACACLGQPHQHAGSWRQYHLRASAHGAVGHRAGAG